MAKDPWYTRCCRCGDPRGIEWHHVIIFQGRQLQERWCIVPACNDCHRQVKESKEVKEFFEWVAFNRATTEELKAISKAINYLRLREVFRKKYENKK